MSNRRFEMYEYRQVIVRMRLGESDREVAKAGVIGRRKAAQLRQLAQAQGWLDTTRALPDDATLAAVLAPAPTEAAAPSASLVEPYRLQVTAWWQAGIAGTTIHQALVRQHGFGGSYLSVARFLQGLKAATPKATTILDFAPGDAAQLDFGSGPRLIDTATGELLTSWVFVMTLCWSRHQYAELVRDQKVATWLACHRRAFDWFNGVPARLIIDNPKCAITRACVRDPEVQRSYGELAEGYGFKIAPCAPRTPQHKGRVEAGVKYVKNNFFPLREFRDFTDANRQLRAWVLETAGNRCHGSTREQPLERFSATEQGLLRPLPDIPPVLATWATVKVHRDAHVQFEKCLYSVPFRLLGQSLWLKATDTTVQLFQDHRLVATHGRLSRPGARATVADHLPPEALAYSLQDTQWCLRRAEQIGPACQGLIQQLFADRIMDNLRAAQGIIRLAKRYGVTRLEAACARALAFDNPRYRTVKTILEKGLDQLSDAEQAFDQLADSYTGHGRFCRDTGKLLDH
jgi:transposase